MLLLSIEVYLNRIINLEHSWFLSTIWKVLGHCIYDKKRTFHRTNLKIGQVTNREVYFSEIEEFSYLTSNYSKLNVRLKSFMFSCITSFIEELLRRNKTVLISMQLNIQNYRSYKVTKLHQICRVNLTFCLGHCKINR